MRVPIGDDRELIPISTRRYYRHNSRRLDAHLIKISILYWWPATPTLSLLSLGLSRVLSPSSVAAPGFSTVFFVWPAMEQALGDVDGKPTRWPTVRAPLPYDKWSLRKHRPGILFISRLHACIPAARAWTIASLGNERRSSLHLIKGVASVAVHE